MSISVDRPSPTRGAPTTSPRQDLITALFGFWMTLGGFIDGFSHRNLNTPETFFTPWHGILYSGYAAAMLWVVWLVVRNRETAPSLRASLPRGYETTAVGLALFGLGGLGDLVWHTVFGIEVSIEALLSPTHILLLIGAILILSGPLRARWWDDDYQPQRLGGFWAPLIAITGIAAELGFFFQYMDGLSSRFMQAVYRPGPEEGYFEVVAGLSSMLITTVIVMGALLFLMRRWRLPTGSAFCFFAVFGLLMEVLEGYDFPEDVIAPLVAGLFAEILIRYLRPEPHRPVMVRLFAFAVPTLMWGVRFVVFEQFSDINWPVAVWSGALVFAGLAGVGLSLLVFPPRPRELHASAR